MSSDENILSLFKNFFRLTQAEKENVRLSVLQQIEAQGATLASYFAGLIRRKEYAALDTVMHLFWMEPDESSCLTIAHEILQSDYIEPNEDIIHFVQKMKRPESTVFIEKSIWIRSSRAPYVGLSMYYNQCGYALRDIGTPEALRLIEECAKSRDSILSAGMKSFIAANMDGPAFEHPDELWW